MSQRPSITVTQSQRLQLNLGLQASIRLLKADAAGLTRYLQEAAAENPALVLEPPPAPLPGEWLPRWSRVFAAEGEAPEQASAGPSLIAHVLAAIDRRMVAPSDRRIAIALAEALEPSGWLGQPLAEIAARLKVRLREVEAVLKRLQEFDPVGLFARDLAECLRLQAMEEGIHDAVMEVVLRNLDLLAKGDLQRLASLAGTSREEIALRFRQIRALNPKPGAEFDAVAVPRPREPDLLARRMADGWEVSLNRSCLPGLRVAEDGARGQVGPARALVRMVQARNDTLLRVGRAILARQVAALDQGAGALAPMTMAEVAKALGLHESTISRVVAGASVDTPQGTWWLKALFSRGLGATGREGTAGAALRERLARLVEAEDRAAPLSDEALAQALSAGGAKIARRTVAKYRGLLRIPPAHRRRARPAR